MTLLKFFQTGRSLVLDDLAREQALLNDANETEMSEELAAELNRASFKDRGERNFFKNQYRRYTRHAASL
jgi:hypothetical protein